jgi:predicted secreted hydrolase
MVLVVVMFVPVQSASVVLLQEPALTPDEEGDHFPCGVEWWWLYTTLTLEDGSQWDTCIMFYYEMNWSTDHWSSTDGFSYIRIESWDRLTGKYYDFLQSDPHPGPFHHGKGMVNLSYDNSTFQGLYPDYAVYCNDDVNGISLSLGFNARAPPHYIGQEAVNGTLPCGTGTFHYWLMPVGMVVGTLTFQGRTQNVTGIGYMEHQFADTHFFDDFFRGQGPLNVLKVGNLYRELSKWVFAEYLSNGLIDWTFLHSSTDSIVGYDWIWIGFPSGWGMILFRMTAWTVEDGPSFGFLIVTNGTSYWEFGDITTRILRDEYLGDRDAYLPMDFAIDAGKGSMTVHVDFKSTTDITKMYFKTGPFELGNFLVAGIANATVVQNGQKFTLTDGKGTNTPCRFIPKNIKYMSTDIDWILPPDGLGWIISGRNHYLHFEYQTKIQIKPYFDVDFSMKPSQDCPGIWRNLLYRLNFLS